MEINESIDRIECVSCDVENELLPRTASFWSETLSGVPVREFNNNNPTLPTHPTHSC